MYGDELKTKLNTVADATQETTKGDSAFTMRVNPRTGLWNDRI